MKKKSRLPLIAALILIILSIVIFYEMKFYTPIDKDESGIVVPISEERLNESARFWYFKKKQTDKELPNQDILSKGVLKVLDLEKSHFEKLSRRVICSETYCEAPKTDVHGNLSGARAMKFDFNDDSIDEIIGYSYSYCHSTECTLYIMKNENGEYENISWVNSFDIKYPIAVLNHKTNGYHDIVIFSLNNPDMPKLRRYGMDLSKGEYDDTIAFDKDNWLKFIKKAR